MNVQVTDSSAANASASAARHTIVIMCRESKSRIAPDKKRARDGGLVKIRVALILPVAVPMPMPTPMPAHFRRRRLRAFLDRSDGGGICQRQRLSLLGRGGKDQYRADCSEAQNSRHLH